MIGTSTVRTSLAALSLMLWGTLLCAQTAGAPAAARDAAVQRVVDDYIGLYRKDTLEQWKTLFLSSFTASYTNADGGVSSRNLSEFYEAQRSGFAAGEMSETLDHVRIQRVGHLAHVAADFRFSSRGSTPRPGQLMLLMIEEKGRFKIAALAFTYHLAGTP